MAKPIRPEWHNEDRIEEMVRSWLEGHGWHVQARSGHTGADIMARDPNGVPWIMEAKGYPSTYKKTDGSTKSKRSIRTQRSVWFIEALGEIVTRMENPGYRYALVFPDHPTDRYFQDRAEALAQFIRTTLNLWIFLLSETGTVRALGPDGNHFEDMGAEKFLQSN